MSPAWSTPTGGIRYHLRALRHRDTLWRPFVDAVCAWLGAWTPPERELVLVGPSAGYSLDPAFLARFARIYALEPDPLARTLFRRRFGAALRASGTELVWEPGDYLSPRGEPARFAIEPFATYLASRPGAAVLFANLLGQLYLLDRDGSAAESFEQWKRDLEPALGQRSFASYHDRLSGTLRPRIPDDAQSIVPSAATNEELAEAFYADALEELHAGEREAELEDHGTAGLFPTLAREWFVWEIRPGWYHLIEAVRHTESVVTP